MAVNRRSAIKTEKIDGGRSTSPSHVRISAMLMATGLVNGKRQISTPYRIDTP